MRGISILGKTVFIETARKLRYEAGWVAVHTDRDPKPILLRADELDCVVMDGRAAFVSTRVLDELASRGCSVIFTDGRHLPASVLLSLNGTIDSTGKVLSQVSWGAWPKKMLWKRVVEAKLTNQSSVLAGAGMGCDAKLLRDLVKEVKAGDSTGREAAGARRYFRSLFGEEFVRERHLGPINQALDYGYSILLSHTAVRIASTGYLNQIGIRHRSMTNPFNLACDLMEPFRPLVDRKVELEGPKELSTEVKRLMVSTLADRISYGGGSYRVSDAIGLWVESCMRVMEGRADVDALDVPEMP